MSVVDTLVVATLAVGLLLGMVRGLLSQITGLVGLIGGVCLAVRYQEPLRKAAFDPFVNTGWNVEITFIGIVVFVVLVAAVLGWIIGKMISKLDMGAYDRLMGAAFGVVKAGLICAGIMLGIVTFAPDGGTLEGTIANSKAGPLLWSVMERASTVLPERFRGEFRHFLATHGLPDRPAETRNPE